VRGEGAHITEVSEAGTVPFLTVANETDRPLLLLDGEELIGVKQNRILNTTVLVTAHTDVTIPVSCVERKSSRFPTATGGRGPARASLSSSGGRGGG
jgi:hypothetical protein